MADYFYTHTLLREGEEIQEVIRRHKSTLIAPIAITSVLIIIPFFFMFYLLSRGPIGTSVFLVLIIFALLYSARVFVTWFFNVFIITNQRIIDIDRTGFFTKTVSEARFDTIADISYSTKGVGQTVFRTGTIQLKTKGESLTLVIGHIADPARVHQLLLDLVKESGDTPPSSPQPAVEDADELIDDFLNEKGDEEEVSFTKKEF